MNGRWTAHLYQWEGEYPDLHLLRPDSKLAAARRRMTFPACCSAINYWIEQNLTGQDAKAASDAVARLVTSTRESTNK